MPKLFVSEHFVQVVGEKQDIFLLWPNLAVLHMLSNLAACAKQLDLWNLIGTANSRAAEVNSLNSDKLPGRFFFFN